jgi:nitrogen fixation/metabolism regulation signal transduction histidine kinase
VSRRPITHEGRVLLVAVLSALPAVAAAVGLLWLGRYPASVRWTLAAVLVTIWLAGAVALRQRVVRALQTIANLLGALREGDYSIRGRQHEAQPRDALGEALAEVNSLADTLSAQRTGAAEASALLAKVMAEIDVAILAFDGQQRLRLINRAGERLLGGREPPPGGPTGDRGSPLLGSTAAALGVAGLLEGETPRTVQAELAGAQGSWELRRGTFRLGGLPHQLLVLADLRRALRQEERLAWQRMVRVLGHEINNSLAPIRSLAGNLQQTLQQPPAARADDWQEDLQRGLAVIERRSEALGRFMTSYARLARLPPPTPGPVDVGAWLQRVVDLEKRLPVRLAAGPPVTIRGDADQLDQLLINLVANAVEAALETGGAVELGWRRAGAQLEVQVTDEGPGLAETHNLFVPFFTTKPAGSGIGLVLCRQIAEAHQGTLRIQNRSDRPGAIARLILPA